MSRVVGSHLVKFTDAQLQELKKRYEAGESSRTLATIYGIHQTTVIARLRQLGATIRPASKPTKMTNAQMAELEAKKQRGATWEDLGEAYDVNDKTLRSAYYRYRDKQLINRQ